MRQISKQNDLLTYMGDDGEFMVPIEFYLQQHEVNQPDTAVGKTTSFLVRDDSIDFPPIEMPSVRAIADKYWQQLERKQELHLTPWYEREVMKIAFISTSLVVVLMAMSVIILLAIII